MSEDLGLQSETTDPFTVKSRLLRASRARQLDILDTKIVKCLGYSYLGLRVEEGICELFSFS